MKESCIVVVLDFVIGGHVEILGNKWITNGVCRRLFVVLSVFDGLASFVLPLPGGGGRVGERALELTLPD